MKKHIPMIAVAVLIVALLVGGWFVGHSKTTGPAPVAQQAPVSSVAETPIAPKYKRDMLEDVVVQPSAAILSTPTPVAGTGRPVLQLDNLAGEIKISSPLVSEGQKLSDDFTCYRKNMSPPITWSNAPSGTKSYVVFFEKIEKSGEQTVLWTVYNISSHVKDLPINLPKTPELEDGMAQGRNDVSNIGYVGPCQPKGEVQYVFEVFAIDKDLNIAPGIHKDDLIRAMNGHIIDMAKLQTYHYRRL